MSDPIILADLAADYDPTDYPLAALVADETPTGIVHSLYSSNPVPVPEALKSRSPETHSRIEAIGALLVAALLALAGLLL